ncbi:hypothetical protein [Cyanobium sp. ATX-6F1]|uniref:hypothetical protein n=1 Tax=Cyanobium sp. ATX-6F1 TaxID=3137388 RepID=UPI0039BE9F52
MARGPRIAVALFTEADAARLRRGDEIELEPQLQTRAQYGGTEQRYGTVRGRIVSLSPAPLGLEALAAAVGGAEEASSLMVRTRQEAFGEGGSPGGAGRQGHLTVGAGPGGGGNGPHPQRPALEPGPGAQPAD